MKQPTGLSFLENCNFWNLGTCEFSRSVYFLIWNIFFKSGSSGQTIMLARCALEFCTKLWCSFSTISHQESNTITYILRKSPKIVSQAECWPEFPSDGSNDDNAPAILPITGIFLKGAWLVVVVSPGNWNCSRESWTGAPFRNGLDLWSIYKDPFQKLNWLTIHIIKRPFPEI